MAIEKPTYKILDKDGSIELREYAAYIRATVSVTGLSHNNAGNNAFSLLADYIFGNNIDRSKIKMTVPVMTEYSNLSTKIAMTAPVTTIHNDNNTYEVSFVMPSEYTIHTIPRPVNTAVTLHEVPKHRSVAITFSGRSSEDTIHSNTNSIQKWIAKNKLTAVSSPSLARYDPPWKPGFMRTNEIIIHVK